jgi:hypothetical protein
MVIALDSALAAADATKFAYLVRDSNGTVQEISLMTMRILIKFL